MASKKTDSSADKSVSSRQGPTVRPHRWLRESTAEEIATALAGIDPEKAIQVVVVLTTRSGQEMAVRIDRAIEEGRSDPKGLAVRLGRSIFREVLR